MLAPLDNEIVFKKAFTERDVLIALVKDIIGIDFNPGKIHTEKQFLDNPGNIKQKYDIYTESVDHRVVVELQRVEYDYHFDRFLYYHNMAIAELQENCRKYKLEKIVYTIVFLVQGYAKNLSKNGEPVEDSVLISQANPRNLNGDEVDLYGHKLIFLNSFYKDDDVPSEYKDWLNLIYESINNKKDFNVNEKKDAIKKVINLIDFEKMTPEERRKMKIVEETKAKEKIRIEELREVKEELADKDKKLADKDKKLADKDKKLADKDKRLADKDKALEIKDKKMAEMQLLIAEMKNKGRI